MNLNHLASNQSYHIVSHSRTPRENKRFLLFFHQFSVRLYEIEKAGRCDVSFSTRVTVKPTADIFRAHVEKFTGDHRVHFHSFVDVDVGGAAQSHLFECILGPHVEPVDRATIDEARIKPKPDPERVANRAEAQHYVQLFFATVTEEGKYGEHRYI